MKPRESNQLSRRQWLGQAGLGVTAAAAGVVGAVASSRAFPADGFETSQSTVPKPCDPETTRPAGERGSGRQKPFQFALNTSTIMGQKLSVPEQIEVAAKAGYDGIEPWIRDLAAFQESGGKLADLRKRLEDHGLVVVGAIGFAPWIVDDPAARAKGLEQMRREMDWVAQLGGRWIAAPPSGATQKAIPLPAIAERYRKLLELGQQVGVIPQLEVWGASQTLGRLSEAVYVAIETGHPQAGLLLDVYQLYKGGSSFEGLRLVAGSVMSNLHMNDYPADPPRETIGDSHRVYPGDGVAPLNRILQILYETGFRGYLSLELFNRDYWKQEALQVARTGLEKMQAAVQKALRNLFAQ
ncbi:MAG: sugar phosphate isomerase/epimerase [Thermoguttaceae bacterium]|nr:sugar phosphate isomerase/epimerase [Thermoguttaceae bacterium]MDW8039074.1 sugar phosphate isomerase/epimerase family protein [Thermoguttaceae bacterium]